MVVGLCTFELRLSWANSLKDKRREIKSLINKTRARYNISIAETGCQDEWRLAELSFAAVSSERRHIDSVMNQIRQYIEQSTEAEIVFWNTDII